MTNTEQNNDINNTAAETIGLPPHIEERAAPHSQTIEMQKKARDAGGTFSASHLDAGGVRAICGRDPLASARMRAMRAI
jgi:hypothetical protein